MRRNGKQIAAALRLSPVSPVRDHCEPDVRFVATPRFAAIPSAIRAGKRRDADRPEALGGR